MNVGAVQIVRGSQLRTLVYMAHRWQRPIRDRARVATIHVTPRDRARVWGLMLGAHLQCDDILADPTFSQTKDHDAVIGDNIVHAAMIRQVRRLIKERWTGEPSRHGDLAVMHGLDMAWHRRGAAAAAYLTLDDVGPETEADAELITLDATVGPADVYVFYEDASETPAPPGSGPDGASYFAPGWVPLECNMDHYESACCGCFGEGNDRSLVEIPFGVTKRLEDPVGFYRRAIRRPPLKGRVVGVCFSVETHRHLLDAAAGGRKYRGQTDQGGAAWLPERNVFVCAPRWQLETPPPEVNAATEWHSENLIVLNPATPAFWLGDVAEASDSDTD